MPFFIATSTPVGSSTVAIYALTDNALDLLNAFSQQFLYCAVIIMALLVIGLVLSIFS